MRMTKDEMRQALVSTHERLALAEATLLRISTLGHNDDCAFCGFKDKQVAVYEETVQRRGL